MTRVTASGLRAAFQRACSSDAARAAFVAAVVAACIGAAHAFGVVLCPMKRFLGVPCPTCGATRAAALLLRGDVVGAFALQPMVATACVVVVPAALLAIAVFGRRRVVAWAGALFRRAMFWLVFALLAVANWVYVIWRGN